MLQNLNNTGTRLPSEKINQMQINFFFLQSLPSLKNCITYHVYYRFHNILILVNKPLALFILLFGILVSVNRFYK